MLKVDSGHMFCAIVNNTDGPAWTGFLNRKSGAIVFVYDDEGEVEDHHGSEVATDAVFDRAAVEAAPDDWIEIPRYDSQAEGRHKEDEFVERFFAEHGIKAELI